MPHNDYEMCFTITGQHTHWDRWEVSYSNDKDTIIVDVTCSTVGHGMVMDYIPVSGTVHTDELDTMTAQFCQQ